MFPQPKDSFRIIQCCFSTSCLGISQWEKPTYWFSCLAQLFPETSWSSWPWFGQSSQDYCLFCLVWSHLCHSISVLVVSRISSSTLFHRGSWGISKHCCTIIFVGLVPFVTVGIYASMDSNLSIVVLRSSTPYVGHLIVVLYWVHHLRAIILRSTVTITSWPNGLGIIVHTFWGKFLR